ncbi:hypothetical protein [Rhizobium sp. JAB6]|uniref:hypothetical protein n=1 Tax=Rhizobium sp. JAB6 TaxID=2127050 RepID=UPI0011B22010|nr:hypothetical protein [Rhizobium sp. JAB6]
MRILTLSVGGRQPIIVFGRRLEWSGPVARLAAIFVLFLGKCNWNYEGNLPLRNAAAMRSRQGEI